MARFSLTFGITTLAAMALVAPSFAQEAAPRGRPGAVDVLTSTARFNTMIEALQTAGMTETLASDTFTIFAPTDEAFARIPEADREALFANPDALRDVLSYHLIRGRFLSTQLSDLRDARSVQGERLPLRTDGRNIFVGEAVVLQGDIAASNGVIHIIDRVLLPMDIKAARRASFLRRNTTLNSETDSLIDLVSDNPDMTMFMTLVRNTLLVDRLTDPEEVFTVFVPSDAAINRLPAETISELMQDREALARVLRNHVVEGDYVAEDFNSTTRLRSLQGEELRFRRADGQMTVGGARIISSDIMADNGVLHLIDQVLMPAQFNVSAQAEE